MAPVALVRRSVQREIIALLLPQALGSQLSLALFGVYVVLHWNYVTSDLYPRLSSAVKATLWTVFLLTTAYEILQAADTLYWTVTADHSVTHIFTGTYMDAPIPLVAATVAVPVQCLLTVRAGALLRTRWIRFTFYSVIGIGIVAAYTGALLMCTTYLLYVAGTIDEIAPLSYNNTASLWLWASAAVDVAISVCLTVTLGRRIRGFSDSTDSLLRKLIKVALKTAAYTALLAVGGAIIASATNDNDVNAAYCHFAFCSSSSMLRPVATHYPFESQNRPAAPLTRLRHRQAAFSSDLVRAPARARPQRIKLELQCSAVPPGSCSCAARPRGQGGQGGSADSGTDRVDADAR